MQHVIALQHAQRQSNFLFACVQYVVMLSICSRALRLVQAVCSPVANHNNDIPDDSHPAVHADPSASTDLVPVSLSIHG